MTKKNTINEHFDHKYGKVGTPGRTVFEHKAEAWFIAQLIRDKRKEAKMTCYAR